MKSFEEQKRKILAILFSRGQQFEKDSQIGEAGNSQEVIIIALTQLNALYLKELEGKIKNLPKYEAKDNASIPSGWYIEIDDLGEVLREVLEGGR